MIKNSVKNEILNPEFPIEDSLNSEGLQSFTEYSKEGDSKKSISNEKTTTNQISNYLLKTNSRYIFSSTLTYTLFQSLKSTFQFLFPISYDNTFFENVFNGKYTTIMILNLYSNGETELVAFSIINIDYKIKEGTIYALGVLPNYQNKKLGSSILCKTIEELSLIGMKKIFLMVQKTNIIARYLYEKFQFKVENIYYSYYNELYGENKIGLKMVKYLDNSDELLQSITYFFKNCKCWKN